MLQRKLFIIYSSVITTVIVIFLIIMNRTLFSIVNENIKADNENIIYQCGTELDVIIQNTKYILLDLCTDDNIQESLLSPSNYSIENLTPEIYHGRLRADINLYLFDGKKFAPFSSSSEESISKERQEWFQHNLDRNGPFLVSTLDENSSHFLTISKIVFNKENWNQIIGIISAEYSYDLLNTAILNQVRLSNKGKVYLMSQDYQTIFPYGIAVNSYLNAPILSGNHSYISDNSYIIERQIDNTPIYLIGSIPLAEIYATSRSAYQLVIISGLLAIIICIIASYWVSRSFTRPIMQLANVMNGIKDGDLDIEIPNQYSGEIGILYGSFNYMIHMIHNLINDNYLINLRKKESELNALQSQINAHFLYNTFDSINWLARKYNADDISRMITSLSRLLRLSLNNGETITTVEKEIAHVQNYIEIQKIRYPDSSLNVEYHIDDQLRPLRISKLLLQPLVENAIQHGFQDLETSNEIIISCYQAGTVICFQVKNNGTDINLDYMHRLINSDPDAPCNSYGVRSISQRLKAYYGPAAHYYYTTENGYTVATIQIDKGALICTRL